MQNIRQFLIFIPLITFLVYVSVLLNIPVFRELIVFVYLSFIPGLAILSLFRLEENSFLDSVVISMGLSITFVMFIGFIINELYLFLAASQPLSSFPIIVATSVFSLGVFSFEYRRASSSNRKWSSALNVKSVIPPTMLSLPPVLSIVGAFFVNVPIMLLSYAVVAALCIMCIASKRLFPPKSYPLLVLSVSIALLCQLLLMSRYIVGFDANLEFYVFRMTQINGHWGLLNPIINPLVTQTFNSMLSITVLPTIYTNLMNTQGEIVFKTLYPFIFCMVPLIMYRIFEKRAGEVTGLLSALFFVFSIDAFYGAEALSLNRQIVGEFFLVLSIFVLLNKAIPVNKRRLLLVIFGASIAASHYVLAFMYVAILALIFFFSRIRPRLDQTLNASTMLLVFAADLGWYSFTAGAPLVSLSNTIRGIFAELVRGAGVQSGAAIAASSLPTVFKASTWINLTVSTIVNVFLLIGVIAITLRPRKPGFSLDLRVLSVFSATIWIVSLVAPGIASFLNFSRFFALSLLFLSPCFVFGGETIQVAFRSVLVKIKQSTNRQPLPRNTRITFLVIAIFLSASFLSQSGFINRVTGGDIHSHAIDFDRMKASNDSQIEVSFYSTFIPECDVFSAVWMLENGINSSTIYSDYESGYHVLTSYGLIPRAQIVSFTNSTTLEQGRFVYLGELNTVHGIINTYAEPLNSSEILTALNQCDLIYSNGGSEIRSVR